MKFNEGNKLKIMFLSIFSAVKVKIFYKDFTFERIKEIF